MRPPEAKGGRYIGDGANANRRQDAGATNEGNGKGDGKGQHYYIAATSAW